MRRGIVLGLEMLCGQLDRLPRVYRSEGHWHISAGCWGCWPLRLADLAMRLDDRWKTDAWGPS